MGTETPKAEEAVSAKTPSKTEEKIYRQVEYYFGDYNLTRDKFLREQVKMDDGWVPLEIMVKFNRLKKLSEDFTVIIEALKKSPKQLMEISDDGKKIRRCVAVPVPEEYSKRQEELDKRSLYVKGFNRKNTLDELLEYFKDHNVEHIFMRRNMQQNDKPFKGSVFVTFESDDDAKKFLETKGLKYNGTELLKEWKVDYTKRKDEYFKGVKAEKEKRLLKKANMAKEAIEANKKVPEFDMVPGCLLKLTNLDRNTLREHIKEVVDPLGTVVYIDYSKGKPSAVIRFETGVASAVLEKIPEEDGEKKIQICSYKAAVTLMEGEEELEYWKNIAVLRAQCRQKYSKGNRNSNKGRFKKWGNKRKGTEEDREDDCSEQSQKKIKCEPTEIKKETEPVSSEASDVKMEASNADS